jgi:glutathione peroxidase
MLKWILTLVILAGCIEAKMKLYEIEVNTIDGKTITLEAYKNRVMLVVNVASKCGFTPQYEGLQRLYDTYKDKGFVVLGFPCNQFMNQEPLDAQQIKSFCSLTYDVDFPLFAKVDVNGANTHDLFVYLKQQQPGILGSQSIKWNFTKFLISKEGDVLKRYAPQTTPKEIEYDIRKLLNE